MWVGAQRHLRVALVGFEFVEDRLDLPPLGIAGGQFGGCHVGRIERRGEQSERSRLDIATSSTV